MYSHYIYTLPDEMFTDAVDIIAGELRSRMRFCAGIPVDNFGQSPDRIFEVWLGQTIETMQVIAFDCVAVIDAEMQAILDTAFRDDMTELYEGITFYRDHHRGFKLKLIDANSVIFSEPDDVDAILAL